MASFSQRSRGFAILGAMPARSRLLFTVAIAALAAFLSPGPAAAAGTPAVRVGTFAERPVPVHGLAADGRSVFLTEPGIDRPGATPRLVVLDRDGAQRAVLPPPPGGFRLPFALRIPAPGRLAVLDSAGFPPVGPPAIHEYRYPVAAPGRARFVRTIGFDGLPLAFAEDFELLPGGGYVVSDSVGGALWLVSADGQVRPGLVPSDPAGLPKLAGCPYTGASFTVGSVPFSPIGGFVPGVGSLAVRRGQLYFGNACLGGLHRLALRDLLDLGRPAEQRARRIRTIAPRAPGTPIESLKGLIAGPSARDPWLYAGDPFRLRFVRIHVRTGERQILSSDERRLDFSVATAYAPPRPGRRRPALLVASDQEYRWTALNATLTRDLFRSPFVLAELELPRAGSGR